MKRFAPIFAILALVVASVCPAAKADIPTIPGYGSLGHLNDKVAIQCPQGQSSAIVYADNANSPSLTATVSTAAMGGNGQALGYGAPLSSVPAGSTTQTTTITSFPNALYLALGSASNVLVQATSYSSGSTNVTIQCSAAVARGPLVTPGPQATFGPAYATTGKTSVSTGTSANTNVILPCGTGATGCSSGVVSLTVGTSIGPKQNWLVTVHEILRGVGVASGYNFGCVTSASTISILSTTWLNTFTCGNTGANYIVGTGEFGQSGQVAGMDGEAWLVGTIANGATFAMSCYGAGSTTTSATLYGYCDVRADPE